MDWLRENWFWLAVGALFFWMHAKMHGGHGAHGGHGGSGGHGGGGGDAYGRAERPDEDGMGGRKEHDHAQH